MISVKEAFEIFGIPGFIIGAFITLGYRFYRDNTIMFIPSKPWYENMPLETLDKIWETESDNSNIGNHQREQFAQRELDKWHIHIPKNRGNVYIYKDIFEKPCSKNNGRHFLRVKIRNMKTGTKVMFQKKAFGADQILTGAWMISKAHPNYDKKHISHNGVHTFEPECLIGQDDVTKEQIGIYFDTCNVNINDLVITEAYFGEKWYWFYNLFMYFPRGRAVE